MLKNRIILILMLGMLSLPTLAVESEVQIETELNKNETVETVAEHSEDVQQTSEGVDATQQKTAVQEQPATESLTTTYKKPISKKKIAKKFIFAMLGVIVSSLIIFVGLSLYNKIRQAFFAPVITAEDRKEALEDPSDLIQAVKSFLDKTHWGE